MDKAFCILAAGYGSRLGSLTEDINKALLPIDNRAAISHIIEKIPKDCDVVVAVGYDKEKVIEYCEAAHPDRTFIFVEVDKIDGPGSGPGYSLLCCKEHLQRPFYLCNVDTLVSNSALPSLNQNWIGVDHVEDTSAYATVEYDRLRDNLIRVWDKGEKPNGVAYIGLLGMRDWEIFWKSLVDFRRKPEFQYIDAFINMQDESGYDLYPGGIQVVKFGWFDTGSVEGYETTCEYFGGEVLGLPKKINEITYKVGGRLVKLCLDKEKNKKRIARGHLLPWTPYLVYTGEYVTAYDWIEGTTLYDESCTLSAWRHFLEQCYKYLWNQVDSVKGWEAHCVEFYYNKTISRVEEYKKCNPSPLKGTWINGYYCYHVDQNLQLLPWSYIFRGIPVLFHGDLQFDNVIYSNSSTFYLIDWRECFAGSLTYGDMYYDLAKLYSGLELPYDKLKREEFVFESDVWNDEVRYSFPINNKLCEFKFMLENWIAYNGYDLYKVKLLAALVYLNMAPLHPGDIGNLLFYHGMFKLQTLLDLQI